MFHNDLLGVLVASFPNQPCAEEAARDLHRAGARHTWLGVTTHGEEGPSLRGHGVGGERHEHVEELGVGHVAARWFHRDHDELLRDALRRHGVADTEARRIDGIVADGSYLLVAEDVFDPSEAASIARLHGGTLLVIPEDLEPPPVLASPHDPLVEARAEAARRHPPRRL